MEPLENIKNSVIDFHFKEICELRNNKHTQRMSQSFFVIVFMKDVSLSVRTFYYLSNCVSISKTTKPAAQKSIQQLPYFPCHNFYKNTLTTCIIVFKYLKQKYNQDTKVSCSSKFIFSSFMKYAHNKNRIVHLFYIFQWNEIYVFF